jgi:ArsR family transcriptional regulator, arsenate/arsenite/antimonite-responsive transcriptional repressor
MTIDASEPQASTCVNILCHHGGVTIVELPITATSAACCVGESCAPITREPIGADGAADLSAVLKALADPMRLRVLSLIAAHEGGEACVCDLTDPIGLSQPTISHHLKVLTDAGFLSRSKRGVWAYYRLVPGSLDAVARTLATV